MSEQKFTASETRQWERLATMMEYYHNHFRQTFDFVYNNADGSFHKRGMGLSGFLREAMGLARHLDGHHRIEEAHFFPILGRKMPQFKKGGRESGEHLKSHQAIHAGLDKYEDLLTKYMSNPKDYNPSELKANMDTWREVLFRHLDEEVADLKGESLRKAGWTLKELEAIQG